MYKTYRFRKSLFIIELITAQALFDASALFRSTGLGVVHSFFYSLTFPLASFPGWVSHAEGHLWVAKYKHDWNTVYYVEEDELSHEELSASWLLGAASLSSCIKIGHVRKDVSDNAIASVDCCNHINYHQEYATHGSRNEENNSSDVFYDVEDSQEKESLVINFRALNTLSYRQCDFAVFLFLELINEIFIIARATYIQRLVLFFW